jgi:hypothetical protein
MRKWLNNASFAYSPHGRGGAVGRFVGVDLFDRRWGFDRSTVFVNGDKYLDRWILYVAGYTLRVHRFFRGDDDRASHTHPWWFVTFPLGAYQERVYRQGVHMWTRVVEAWRFHYRPAHFEHYVVKGVRLDRSDFESGAWTWSKKPWWTIVITGVKRDTWGFYPKPGEFVNWKEWK